MTNKNRLVALVLSLTVLLVILSSVFFIAIEADHDCIGDDCPICYQIGVCENTLKSIGQAVIVVVIAAFIGLFSSAMPSFIKKMAFNTSLVTLRVKLSN